VPTSGRDVVKAKKVVSGVDGGAKRNGKRRLSENKTSTSGGLESWRSLRLHRSKKIVLFFLVLKVWG
jgi:hypothetical protein